MTDQSTLIAAARQHEDTLLRHRIVLYAGANYPSAAVQAAYVPALSAMPSMGPSFAKEQPGAEIVSELEVAVRERACAIFGAAWAEPRLPSATLANLAVFQAFGARGDLLLAPAAAHGAHLSQRGGGTPDLAGLATADLPFNTETLTLDTPAAVAQIKSFSPKLVMLGRSVMIQPDDIAPVAAAARKVGALTIFDASHISGLIAGGTYPNPLKEGADIVTTSTYKTIAGAPQGLVFGAHEEHGRTLAQFLDRAFLANSDAGKLPQLLVALDELTASGIDYARRVVANTASLADAFAMRDFLVRAARNGRHTHQLLIPIAPGEDLAALIRNLERCGIVVGTCNDIGRPGGTALRVGTQFVTRQGFTAAGMKIIAGLLADLLVAAPDGVRLKPASDRRSILEDINRMLAGVSATP
ncbi:glycine hydroxymethyltransferase [Terrihabitans sp. B22-R8]|uniref:glycine hydroxymethyltransferase n=1 Tax=Terrihabitans sp. B22-R8 TaxID=3425128 RepID=UPI00403C2120